MSEKRRYRCAIYTRKSHEEGLDQDFNSLDAQREACEAYILSQAGLGWELSPKLYDDGGISGGHLDRAGLQALLTDIRAGQIDIVVVYKVDRLTRSITDFGRLVETFDEQDVSFVSVTQAFNTTNSMGRLTLNVLLSFAQFEREVTAERIRDKIAGSKQKGMWMGGRVPYGYQNHDKKLFIHEVEAANLRLMFELYLKHKSLSEVKQALDQRNVVSRQKTNKSGMRTGGLPFTAGNIRSILSNPVYAGDIRHKQNVYRGNHEPIVERAVWNEVQSDLANQNNIKQNNRTRTNSPALLKGMLYDVLGNRLVAHHVNKKGNKYYYYVTKAERGKEKGDGNRNQHLTSDTITSEGIPKTALTQIRLPMQKIEKVIQEHLIATFKSKQSLLEMLKQTKIEVHELYAIFQQSETLAKTIESANHLKLEAIYQKLIKRIIIHSDNIEIEFEPNYLTETLGFKVVREGQRFRIRKSTEVRRRGQELKFIIGGKQAEEKRTDMSLIRLIAKAHLLKNEIETGAISSIKEFAEKYSFDHGDAKNLIPLSYLAPSIIDAIYDGTQPTSLTTSRLKSVANRLPIRWIEQRQVLGFAT